MAAQFSMQQHLPRLIDTLQRVAGCGKPSERAGAVYSDAR